MPSRRLLSTIVSGRVRVTWVLVSLGLALFAVRGSAQPAPATTTENPIEFWTPRAQTGTLHLHGGVYAPINANATSSTLGARLGLNLGSHLLLGIGGDWIYKSKSASEAVEDGLPGFEPQIQLAKVDAHLVPTMLFLQVKLTDKFPLVPYAGIGAGYEWLVLRAKDYRTDESASRTYDNWSWQTYVGMGMKLSKGLRIDGELAYNGGLLGRDVTDENGEVWRETVDVSGVGARIGLDIVY